ncbi:MAG: peptide deformylase [Myxococcota bacterium]|jgi:peptide deformylase
MALLDIITVPHPTLAAEARDVRDDEFGSALATLLSSMAETMYAAPGVGLAAPQVNDGRRIIVVDPGEGDERGTRLYKMVNPRITDWSKETIPWRETCLSVPEFEVEVTRNFRVFVEWRDAKGDSHSEWFEEFQAVIIQHELDHLVGTVLLDRVSNFRKRRYLKKAKSRDRAMAL